MRISDWSSDVALPILHEVALVAGRVVVAGADRHVGGLAFVNQRRRLERRAALPLLDDARVAGFGHRTGTEVGGHVHGVAVDPAQAALGLRALEAAFHPLLRGQVELAGHVGVGAAARAREQAEGDVRAQAVRAVPEPAPAFGPVQGDEVVLGSPLWSLLALLPQGGLVK